MNALTSRLNSALAGRAWLTVALLWVIALVNYLDRLMITTMRDPIKADITMTDAQFGLLTSVFLWVYGVFSPLGGFLADRFSRTRVIIASLLIWSAVTWLTGHMHSVEGLLTARALMGLSEACYVPAALALIADYHPGPTRSLATGLHMSGIYAGAALGGVGGYIAEHFGWRAGFNLFGAFGVGYAVVTLFLLRDVAGKPAAAPGDQTESPAAKVGRDGRARGAVHPACVPPAFTDQRARGCCQLGHLWLAADLPQGTFPARPGRGRDDRHGLHPGSVVCRRAGRRRVGGSLESDPAPGPGARYRP